MPAAGRWLAEATSAGDQPGLHSEQIADWASRPIVLGPGGTLQPLVLGPRRVPLIRDVEAARRAPELAVLSALVHGQGPVDTATEVALAAAEAAHELDRDQFLLYFGLIWASLSDAAKKVFQMLPQGAQFFDESQQRSYERGLEKGLEKGRSQGLAESKAAAVLAVLEARGLTVTDEQRDRIRSTTDLETLDRWVRRAETVESIDALFE